MQLIKTLISLQNASANWKHSREQLFNTIRQAKLRMVAQVLTRDEITANGQENHHLNTPSSNISNDISDATLDRSGNNTMCCSYCKRTFGANVILKHETICGRLFRKKHFNV